MGSEALACWAATIGGPGISALLSLCTNRKSKHCASAFGAAGKEESLGYAERYGKRGMATSTQCRGSDANALATCQHVGALWLLRVTPRSLGLRRTCGYGILYARRW